MNPEIQASLPYPELSDVHRRALEMLWEFHAEHGRWPRLVDEVRYYAMCDGRAVEQLRTLQLTTVTRPEPGPELLRPSALGVAYLTAEEARTLLTDLDALCRYVASRFHPDVHELPFDEITKATQLDAVRLLELAPFAADLELYLNEHGRSVGRSDWGCFADGLQGVFARMAPGEHGSRHACSDSTASALPLRLRSLEVEHFRTLCHLELDLASPLTVLVGPNGVGKSTTLDALGFLSVAARSGLALALDRELGLARLRQHGSRAPVILRLGFELDAGFGFRAGEYLVELDDPRGVVAVRREELVYQGQDGDIVWLHGGRAMTRLRRTDGAEEERYHAVDALGLEGARDASRYPIIVALRQALAAMTLVDRDPIFDSRQPDAASPLYARVQPVDVGQEPTTRRRRGAHTSPLECLHRAVPDDESARRLGEVLSRLVPTVRRIQRRVVTNERAELDIFEESSDAPAHVDELSQGTRQMLLLAALYVHPNPPAIVLLEEPDAGLHPAVLAPLVDLLREMSQRSSILATTHSPYFVALLDREREVVALERRAHGVHAEPLAHALSSKRWLDSMDPAQAFFRQGLERPA